MHRSLPEAKSVRTERRFLRDLSLSAGMPQRELKPGTGSDGWTQTLSHYCTFAVPSTQSCLPGIWGGGGFGRLQKHFRQQNTKYLPGEDRQAASKPAYFIQYSFISTICVNLGGDRCAPKIKKNSVSHCPKVSSRTAKATIPTQKHCQSSSQILFTRRTRPRGPGLNR